MTVRPTEIVSIARVRDDQIVTLSKLVLQSAFQPIAEAATGIVFGYESLMRGFDHLGFSSPVELLDRAYACGELEALEHLVVSRACAAFAALPAATGRTLFVNFDSRLIAPEAIGMIGRLAAHLRRANIPASSICFELSERFADDALPALPVVCDALRRSGFKLAIDDFGVGFSGLKVLTDQPVDYVKLDRHFVSGIDATMRKRHVVRHIVATAHLLGTRVIAEGVETEAEFLTCRDLGCDLVQGHYIAWPTIDHQQLQPAYGHLEQAGRVRHAHRSLDSVQIREKVEVVPALSEEASLEAVFDLFRRSPERSFFPVVNASGEPRGILHEHHLKELIYHPFGRDLLKNHLYRRRLSHFVSPAPIADLDLPAEEILEVFAGAETGDCVILTENMRYVGVLSAAALLRIIHDKQLQHAQDQNPLTGLPGNRAIRDRVQQMVLDGDEVRHVCYCDFDKFKPFNDVYGFQKGDMAITLFAALLRRHFFSADAFIAHIGGDDFFISLKGWTEADVTATLTRLLEDFAGDVRQLYTSDHLAAGRMIAADRHGAEAMFPLMRCSIAVLALPKGVVFSEIQPVSLRIAGMKKTSKASASGLVMETIG